DEAGGAHYGTGVVGLVRHLRGELAVGIGDEDDVVIAAGGEHGDIAEVAVARIVARNERPDIDNPALEIRGRLAQRGDHRGVLRAGALQHEDVPPAARYQILQSGVRQHPVARYEVDDVRAAIQAAKAVVG